MGKTAKELVDDFHTAMDDYLALCEDEGIKPEAAYKGSFYIRISTERIEQKKRRCSDKSPVLRRFYMIFERIGISGGNYML